MFSNSVSSFLTCLGCREWLCNCCVLFQNSLSLASQTCHIQPSVGLLRELVLLFSREPNKGRKLISSGSNLSSCVLSLGIWLPPFPSLPSCKSLKKCAAWTVYSQVVQNVHLFACAHTNTSSLRDLRRIQNISLADGAKYKGLTISFGISPLINDFCVCVRARARSAPREAGSAGRRHLFSVSILKRGTSVAF